LVSASPGHRASHAHGGAIAIALPLTPSDPTSVLDAPRRTSSLVAVGGAPVPEPPTRVERRGSFDVHPLLATVVIVVLSIFAGGVTLLVRWATH
jgi:hypothetical protein